MGKIYTKTGDDGLTSLVGGERVSKCSPRLESYGTVDELNSNIGVLIASMVETGSCKGDDEVVIRSFLCNVQRGLFVVGGYLATDTSKRETTKGTTVTQEMVDEVEKEIDRLTTLLKPQRAFILPGGCLAAAHAHVCRTVCRRAERDVLRLQESGVEVDTNVKKYLNRLSDYFFVLSRKLNADAGVEDVEW
ncbi:MAG: cob(I)yrinic acid a,c-diamide adenosyltransferase [Prevotella sp.]|nr:cob(I)yrinic acid a,c-diamide adenosyltransferase [Prevotella sp.]